MLFAHSNVSNLPLSFAPLLSRGHLPLIPFLEFHFEYPRANGIRAILHLNIHFTSL
jgi:hypothetical protein